MSEEEVWVRIQVKVSHFLTQLPPKNHFNVVRHLQDGPTVI